MRPRFGFPWDAQRARKLAAMLEASIQRRFPRGLKVHVQSVDSFGCLAALTAVLRDAGLTITRAKVALTAPCFCHAAGQRCWPPALTLSSCCPICCTTEHSAAYRGILDVQFFQEDDKLARILPILLLLLMVAWKHVSRSPMQGLSAHDFISSPIVSTQH